MTTQQIEQGVISMPLVAHGDVVMYTLSEAARLVRKNHWDIAVDGIHSESLRRTWRDSNGKYGTRIGRDVWFSADDMMRMGYAIEEPKNLVEIGDVIYIGKEKNDTG